MVTAPPRPATLVVNEVFGPTIQGEGPSAGRLAKFLRLAGCNLDCGRGAGATWACDTPYSWDWSRFQHSDEAVHRPAYGGTLAVELDDVPLVVISGGEPMLQQRHLAPLVELLLDRGQRVEVETNGTVPVRHLPNRTRFNVSVKLANSGVPVDRRFNEEAIKSLRATGRASWKFVVARPSDLHEVADIVFWHELEDVWIMPAGATQESMLASARAIADEVVRVGWNLTLRSHLCLWGASRGH